MRKPLSLSLLSAFLLSAGWLSMSGLTLLVALVPLLITSGNYDSSTRQWWKMLGWCALSLGLWSGVTTWWIWYAAPIGAILSVIITNLLFGGAFMLYHYVSKRAPRSLAYTVLVCGWIAMEYLYTTGEISFPWIMLGNGFANDVEFVQWYEYTGIFGGSLWVLVSNILIYRVFEARTLKRSLTAALWIVIPVTVSLVIYLTYREKGETIKVSVVQPNLDPYQEKFTMDFDSQMLLFSELISHAPQGVELIVLPETSIDDGLEESQMDTNESVLMLRESARSYPGVQIIAGATTFRYYYPGNKPSATARQSDGSDIWYDVYNSALAIDSSGVEDVHHKSKLVVGVEKMPYYAVLKHLEFMIVDLGGISGQLGHDSLRKVFTTPKGVRTASSICYESIYGGYFAEFVRGGAQVMTIITNDGWWDNTAGHRHHFAYARLRAIETRRAIARSANTGISGFINQRGDKLLTLGWDKRGTITENLTTNDRITFYVRYGDYIGRLASYTFVLCLLYFVAYRVRRRNHLVK